VNLSPRLSALVLAALLAATGASAAEPPAVAPAPVTVPNPALPSLTGLVESVRSAVVNVEVTARVDNPRMQMDPGGDFWEHFFGPDLSPRGPRGRQPRDRVQQGLGSGFIVSSDGLVLTNNHVVEGAVTIRIKLEDGRRFEAEVKGRDPLTDVALVKLKGSPKDLPVVKLGDSDALKVGEWVVAIGNPFGLASSVSAGILSARARNIGAGPYDDFLQTDAAINPGNSGGPLFNLRGEVVGINTAIVGGGSGIGFAVPSNLVQALLPQLEKEGLVTRGWLGVAVQDATASLDKALGVPVSDGALIADVNPGSPAEKAGLKRDDVVVAIDGTKVASSGELTRRVALKKPGSSVAMTVYRGGKKEEKKVTLGTRPDLEGLGNREQKRSPPDVREEKVGLSVEDVPQQLQAQHGLPKGALVVEVRPGSEADRAELMPGMVVVEAAGKPIHSAADLKRALSAAQPGSTMLLRVQMGESGRVLRALTLPGGQS
jgi:serine protease Do